jgi:hypothetical protein
MTKNFCRHCERVLHQLFLDLGHAPPSNAYLTKTSLNAPELTYPLRLRVCQNCYLVQTEDFTEAKALFSADYAYFSSTSSSWVNHAARYVEMIQKRLNLQRDSFVIEVASNDGYLLRNFVSAGIPCLGIEPTKRTAAVAIAQGIPVRQAFFGQKLGEKLAAEGKRADLIMANNVYAHVPKINDFTRGLVAALKPKGIVTLEFQHLMRLVEFCQFDTIYHEHFSYLSLISVSRIFSASGLRVFDVEELPTHGGSLRVYGCLSQSDHTETPAVEAIMREEQARGMDSTEYYKSFKPRVDTIKNALLSFLLKAKQTGKTVAAYGAAAKGNTLLNYSGVKSDLLPFVCDAAVAKQGRFLPGSHIPILHPDILSQSPPDYILILPWNLEEEIRDQLRYLRKHGTNFVTSIPELIVR